MASELDVSSSTRLANGGSLVASEGAALSLHQCCLVLEDVQCLFEALDFCSTPLRSLFITLWLSNTPVFDLGIVLHDSIKLFLYTIPVTGKLCQAGIQLLELSCLEFHILILLGLCNFVFLFQFVVLLLRICLSGLLLSQRVGKITFTNLEDVDDVA